MLEYGRQQAIEMVIAMYVSPEAPAAITPEYVLQAEGESAEDYPERQAPAVELWSIPDIG